MCGGTPDYIIKIAADSGLSPRVRGNLENSDIALFFEGSIPACAGEPRYSGGVACR